MLYYLMTLPESEKPEGCSNDDAGNYYAGTRKGNCKPKNKFHTLPGLDQLDGKQWGGVIMEDSVGSLVLIF